MGKWMHRLTEIDIVSATAKCQECGTVRIISKPRNYGKRGWVCQKAKQQRNHKSAKKNGKRKFYGRAYPCQMDIDHIDGNHKNDNKENLQALCANCHRLKSKKNKEGIYKNTL